MARWAWHGLTAGFLPNGYPSSVRSTYLSYAKWSAIGLVAGRVQSVLATQAALFTIGLGAGAIPMAAATQWVLKDGVGHAGAIIYAASVNTRFDADAKRYRFHSTIALTAADLIAVMMPLMPQHFFVMASLSSAMSSIANLAQVAARARIMSSFAVTGNLADCVRAGQTQSKLMSIIGTGTGAGLSWVIGPEPYHVIGAMIPLAAVSCYAMHTSSCLVVMRTLNLQRCERVFADMLKEIPGDANCMALVPPTVRTPEEVAAMETFTLGYRSILPGRLYLQPLFAAKHPWGTQAKGEVAEMMASLLGLDDVTRGAERAEQLYPRCASWHDGYVLVAGISSTGGAVVGLWHAAHTDPSTKLRAVWHASLARIRLAEQGGSIVATQEEIRKTLAQIARITGDMWPHVEKAVVSAGWELQTVFLDGDGGCLDLNDVKGE